MYRNLIIVSSLSLLIFALSSCNSEPAPKSLDPGIKINQALLDATAPSKEVLEKPAIFFYYADWCPYCRKMKPHITQLQQKYKDKITFRMIDVDTPKGQEISASYRKGRQGGIPYTQFYNTEGSFVNEALGLVPYEELERVTKTSFKF